jgi:hypothetical protein
MSCRSQDLTDCTPFFLERLGFREREQTTTDDCRLAEWVLPVTGSAYDCAGDEHTGVALCVLYELSIYDDPNVRYIDNLHYQFRCVSLRVYDVETESRREAMRGTAYACESDSDFLDDGTLVRVDLPVHTKPQLRSLLRLLPRPGQPTGENPLRALPPLHRP